MNNLYGSSSKGSQSSSSFKELDSRMLKSPFSVPEVSSSKGNHVTTDVSNNVQQDQHNFLSNPTLSHSDTRRRRRYKTSLETILECDGHYKEPESISSCDSSSYADDISSICSFTSNDTFSGSKLGISASSQNDSVISVVCKKGQQRIFEFDKQRNDKHTNVQTLYHSSDWTVDEEDDIVQNRHKLSCKSDMLTKYSTPKTLKLRSRSVSPPGDVYLTSSVAMLKYACWNHQYEKGLVDQHQKDSPGGDIINQNATSESTGRPRSRPPRIGAPDELSAEWTAPYGPLIDANESTIVQMRTQDARNDGILIEEKPSIVDIIHQHKNKITIDNYSEEPNMTHSSNQQQDDDLISFDATGSTIQQCQQSTERSSNEDTSQNKSSLLESPNPSSTFMDEKQNNVSKTLDELVSMMNTSVGRIVTVANAKVPEGGDTNVVKKRYKQHSLKSNSQRYYQTESSSNKNKKHLPGDYTHVLDTKDCTSLINTSRDIYESLEKYPIEALSRDMLSDMIRLVSNTILQLKNISTIKVSGSLLSTTRDQFNSSTSLQSGADTATNTSSLGSYSNQRKANYLNFDNFNHLNNKMQNDESKYYGGNNARIDDFDLKKAHKEKYSPNDKTRTKSCTGTRDPSANSHKSIDERNHTFRCKTSHNHDRPCSTPNMIDNRMEVLLNRCKNDITSPPKYVVNAVTQTIPQSSIVNMRDTAETEVAQDIKESLTNPTAYCVPQQITKPELPEVSSPCMKPETISLKKTGSEFSSLHTVSNCSSHTVGQEKENVSPVNKIQDKKCETCIPDLERDTNILHDRLNELKSCIADSRLHLELCLTYQLKQKEAIINSVYQTIQMKLPEKSNSEESKTSNNKKYHCTKGIPCKSEGLILPSSFFQIDSNVANPVKHVIPNILTPIRRRQYFTDQIHNAKYPAKLDKLLKPIEKKPKIIKTKETSTNVPSVDTEVTERHVNLSLCRPSTDISIHGENGLPSTSQVVQELPSNKTAKEKKSLSYHKITTTSKIHTPEETPKNDNTTKDVTNINKTFKTNENQCSKTLTTSQIVAQGTCTSNSMAADSEHQCLLSKIQIRSKNKSSTDLKQNLSSSDMQIKSTEDGDTLSEQKCETDKSSDVESCSQSDKTSNKSVFSLTKNSRDVTVRDNSLCSNSSINSCERTVSYCSTTETSKISFNSSKKEIQLPPSTRKVDHRNGKRKEMDVQKATSQHNIPTLTSVGGTRVLSYAEIMAWVEKSLQHMGQRETNKHGRRNHRMFNNFTGTRCIHNKTYENNKITKRPLISDMKKTQPLKFKTDQSLLDTSTISNYLRSQQVHRRRLALYKAHPSTSRVSKIRKHKAGFNIGPHSKTPTLPMKRAKDSQIPGKSRYPPTEFGNEILQTFFRRIKNKIEEEKEIEKQNGGIRYYKKMKNIYGSKEHSLFNSYVEMKDIQSPSSNATNSMSKLDSSSMAVGTSNSVESAGSTETCNKHSFTALVKSILESSDDTLKLCKDIGDREDIENNLESIFTSTDAVATSKETNSKESPFTADGKSVDAVLDMISNIGMDDNTPPVPPSTSPSKYESMTKLNKHNNTSEISLEDCNKIDANQGYISSLKHRQTNGQHTVKIMNSRRNYVKEYNSFIDPKNNSQTNQCVVHNNSKVFSRRSRSHESGIRGYLRGNIADDKGVCEAKSSSRWSLTETTNSWSNAVGSCGSQSPNFDIRDSYSNWDIIDDLITTTVSTISSDSEGDAMEWESNRSSRLSITLPRRGSQNVSSSNTTDIRSVSNETVSTAEKKESRTQKESVNIVKCENIAKESRISLQSIMDEVRATEAIGSSKALQSVELGGMLFVGVSNEKISVSKPCRSSISGTVLKTRISGEDNKVQKEIEEPEVNISQPPERDNKESPKAAEIVEPDTKTLTDVIAKPMTVPQKIYKVKNTSNPRKNVKAITLEFKQTGNRNIKSMSKARLQILESSSLSSLSKNILNQIRALNSNNVSVSDTDKNSKNQNPFINTNKDSNNQSFNNNQPTTSIESLLTRMLHTIEGNDDLSGGKLTIYSKISTTEEKNKDAVLSIENKPVYLPPRNEIKSSVLARSKISCESYIPEVELSKDASGSGKKHVKEPKKDIALRTESHVSSLQSVSLKDVTVDSTSDLRSISIRDLSAVSSITDKSTLGSTSCDDINKLDSLKRRLVISVTAEERNNSNDAIENVNSADSFESLGINKCDGSVKSVDEPAECEDIASQVESDSEGSMVGFTLCDDMIIECENENVVEVNSKIDTSVQTDNKPNITEVTPNMVLNALKGIILTIKNSDASTMTDSALNTKSTQTVSTDTDKNTCEMFRNNEDNNSQGIVDSFTRGFKKQLKKLILLRNKCKGDNLQQKDFNSDGCRDQPSDNLVTKLESMLEKSNSDQDESDSELSSINLMDSEDGDTDDILFTPVIKKSNSNTALSELQDNVVDELIILNISTPNEDESTPKQQTVQEQKMLEQPKQGRETQQTTQEQKSQQSAQEKARQQQTEEEPKWEQPAEEQATQQQSVREKTTQKQPTRKQATQEQPTREQTRQHQPTEEQAGHQQPTEAQARQSQLMLENEKQKQQIQEQARQQQQTAQEQVIQQQTEQGQVRQQRTQELPMIENGRKIIHLTEDKNKFVVDLLKAETNVNKFQFVNDVNKQGCISDQNYIEVNTLENIAEFRLVTEPSQTESSSLNVINFRIDNEANSVTLSVESAENNNISSNINVDNNIPIFNNNVDYNNEYDTARVYSSPINIHDELYLKVDENSLDLYEICNVEDVLQKNYDLESIVEESSVQTFSIRSLINPDDDFSSNSVTEIHSDDDVITIHDLVSPDSVKCIMSVLSYANSTDQSSSTQQDSLQGEILNDSSKLDPLQDVLDVFSLYSSNNSLEDELYTCDTLPTSFLTDCIETVLDQTFLETINKLSVEKTSYKVIPKVHHCHIAAVHNIPYCMAVEWDQISVSETEESALPTEQLFIMESNIEDGLVGAGDCTRTSRYIQTESISGLWPLLNLRDILVAGSSHNLQDCHETSSMSVIVSKSVGDSININGESSVDDATQTPSQMLEDTNSSSSGLSEDYNTNMALYSQLLSGYAKCLDLETESPVCNPPPDLKRRPYRYKNIMLLCAVLCMVVFCGLRLSDINYNEPFASQSSQEDFFYDF